MRTSIKQAIAKIDTVSATKPLLVISHYDTDGITAAAIFARALQRWNKNFSLKIKNTMRHPTLKVCPSGKCQEFANS